MLICNIILRTGLRYFKWILYVLRNSLSVKEVNPSENEANCVEKLCSAAVAFGSLWPVAIRQYNEVKIRRWS